MADESAYGKALSEAKWERILGPARKSWADRFLIPAITDALLVTYLNQGRQMSTPTEERKQAVTEETEGVK
jgi:hypothetical protein